MCYLHDEIGVVSGKSKSTCSKREKLWSFFHQARNDPEGVLLSHWKQLLLNLDIKIDDPILMQSVYQQLFEDLMRAHSSIISTTGEKTHEDVVFTRDELNALRYACGYVAHSLLKRFEKKVGEKFSQFVTCLGEMAVAGEGEDLSSIH